MRFAHAGFPAREAGVSSACAMHIAAVTDGATHLFARAW